jgi:NFACT N-terminal and middle domains/NFACT protein RNA binding domain
MQQNNYYTLKALVAALEPVLVGRPLAECFSQNRDELVLGWGAAEQADFYLRANLAPDFCCLSFPASYQRARQNSVDLFRPLLGQTVQGLRLYQNERCFSLHFAAGVLLFKMHGQRANLVLFEADGAGQWQPTELFHQKLGKDWGLRLDELDRPLDQTAAGLAQQGLAGTFPTLDRALKTWLDLESRPPEAHWSRLAELLAHLETPTFWVGPGTSGPAFSLLPPPHLAGWGPSPDVLAALNEFYAQLARQYYFHSEKSELQRGLEKQKQKIELYLQKGEEKLIELEIENRYEEIANILMANLHQVPARASTVELFDFYHNRPLAIKLNAQLSPAKNAEAYYRKGKNHGIEVARLQQNLAQKQAELSKLNAQITDLQTVDRLKELRRYAKEEGLVGSQAEADAFPFKRFAVEGYQIWVGRNARNNDLLTQKYAYKEDLWLHARDVAGSHVVVKHQAGRNFPAPVIERAAQLAAWFSKRKTDSLCPVIYTPKKYVRKPKGLAEGAVVVDQEQVIMVVPTGPEQAGA